MFLCIKELQRSTLYVHVIILFFEYLKGKYFKEFQKFEIGYLSKP
jgi:hypothetical protein